MKRVHGFEQGCMVSAQTAERGIAWMLLWTIIDATYPAEEIPEYANIRLLL